MLCGVVSGCDESASGTGRAGKGVVPAVISLEPFAIERGYYVRVTNPSSAPLSEVMVFYYGAQGETKIQEIATLAPGASVRLDPSDIGWRVSPHEGLGVSARDYAMRRVKTDLLIDQATK